MRFYIRQLAPDGTAIDLNAPLIYLWEIFNAAGDVVGRYVGKADGGDRRPMEHYKRNVIKLLDGRPYKKGKSYRRVHYGLAAAVQAEHNIVLSYLCNVPASQNIFEVESLYIETLGCTKKDGIGLNGPGVRPYVALPASTDVVVEEYQSWSSRQVDKPSTRDLDYIYHYVQEAYPELRPEAKDKERRISFFVAGQDSKQRIIRFAQSGPRGRVKIKLAQSWREDRSISEVLWDGTDDHIDVLIDSQSEIYRLRRT